MVDTEQRIALILQSCIDAIQTGQDTLDGVLARYPDLADTLRPQIESALWLVQRADVLAPDPATARQRRQRFEARLRAQQRAARPSLRDIFASIFRLPPVALRAAAMVALVFILLIATDRVVTATETSIPGDAGYTVKRTFEGLSLAVSPDPGQQIVLYLEYSDRRLTEVDQLLDESRFSDATQTLDEFEDQVRSAVASLDKITDQDTVHKELLAMTIQDKLTDHTRKLDAILPKMPAAGRPAVQSAMLVSNDGLVVASTAIKRLMSLQTPEPSGPFALPTLFDMETPTLVQPTEETFLLPYLTPTEEFKQIFSSTTAPEATRAPAKEETPVPTLPVIVITATPVPTLPNQEPTALPTLPPPPTRTPLPSPTPTNTPEPTLSGVFTPTPSAIPTGQPGINSPEPPSNGNHPTLGAPLPSATLPTATPIP